MKTVIEIAREADLKSNKGGPYRIDPETGAWLERFAEIVRADEREALAQPEQEPLAYAGVKVWVGNQQVVRLLTQTELHYSGEPWLLVELNALKCVAALKEKTA